MKKYIDFNTEKRANAGNISEQDFSKLMINSAFGKTIENLRKRINVRLVSSEKKFKTHQQANSDYSKNIW